MSHLALPEILMRLAITPALGATCLGAVRFQRLPLNLRYLVGMLAFVLPLNVLGVWMMMYHRNNLFLMPVYAVGEFGLLAMVYRHTLQWATFTRWLPVLVGGFTAYVLLDCLLAPDWLRFRPGQQVMQSLLVLLLVTLYFRKVMTELYVPHLRREPMFWVSAGLSIYYLGYLQIALFSNYLLRYSYQLNKSIWAIHSLLVIFLYACYSYALWLTPPK